MGFDVRKSKIFVKDADILVLKSEKEFTKDEYFKKYPKKNC